MKQKTKNLISIIILIIFLLIAKIYIEKQNRNSQQLLKKGDVTVGLITKKNGPGPRTISGNTYFYLYYIDSIKYFGAILNDINYPIGSYFEVLYLADKPTKSTMNFTNPVEPENVCNYFKKECPFRK